MKFDRYYKSHTSHTSASAPCANAGTSCAHSADNGIIAVLDAILVSGTGNLQKQNALVLRVRNLTV